MALSDSNWKYRLLLSDISFFVGDRDRYTTQYSGTYLRNGGEAPLGSFATADTAGISYALALANRDLQ